MSEEEGWIRSESYPPGRRSTTRGCLHHTPPPRGPPVKEESLVLGTHAGRDDKPLPETRISVIPDLKDPKVVGVGYSIRVWVSVLLHSRSLKVLVFRLGL